jgi:Holliday junction resolvase RusA-like endonuclease
VLIVALFEIPKSTSKKRAELMRAGEIRPTKGGRGNPDLDNIAKAICDALNGIAYHDDAQVVDLKVVKYYSDTPCVTVTVEEVTEDDSKANDN